MQTEEVVLKVDGMTCSNCAAGISKSLKGMGYNDAFASFSDGEVSFSTNATLNRIKAIEQIQKLGYTVEEDADSAETTGISSLEKKLIISALLSLPLFMHMFVGHDSVLNNPIVQLCLATPVYFIGASHFGKSAWGSIKSGMANMDVLIFAGSTAAYVYSIAGMVIYWGLPESHNYMFFETAAMIITLVLMGNVIEHRAVKKTSEEIGELTQLQAEKATIVMKMNGKEKFFEADVKVVKIGDELQVNEGDRIPVDGQLVTGSIQVDESMITGESEPVSKKVGDQILSGTTILDGNCRMEATAISKDSTLERIISLVKKARREQPTIQKLGDRVSGIFVPVVMVISALTFLITYFFTDTGLTQSVLNAIAVLVISCPCAMGLATPTAVVSGIGRAAKKGILLKGGDTLERYAKADVFLFDKTGTLTTGNFTIELTENSVGQRAGELIKALESHSSHPIAKSFLQHFANKESESLTEIQEIKGEGIKGKTENGEAVYFGKDTDNKSDLVLKLNKHVVCRATISDELKADTNQVIHQLQQEGKQIAILSGDRKEKVQKVAATLGISEYYSEMKPEKKLEFIESLAAEKIVVMVGDGINDGPSLSKAQVGISPGGASSLAIDSARVVLMRPDEMKALADSYKISQYTYRTIKQNLFWAFFYNAIAIPIAAIGLLNPMVAALSMAFSDVIVIGNSLRLKVRKIK